MVDPLTLIGAIGAGASGVQSLIGGRKAKRKAKRAAKHEKARMAEFARRAGIRGEETAAEQGLVGELGSRRRQLMAEGPEEALYQARKRKSEVGRSIRSQTFADLAGLGSNVATGIGALNFGAEDPFKIAAGRIKNAASSLPRFF